jgi:hypothetical protein
MSVTLTYVKAHDLSQLHEELLAAGLTPERVEGLGDDVTLTFPDGQAQGPVDAVVAAHVPMARYDPATRLAEVDALRRAGGRAALRVRAAKATTVAELRDVLLAHLTDAEEEAEAG